jgi:biotin synthase
MTPPNAAEIQIRTDWTLDEVRALFALPFADLLFHAQQVHRACHDPNRVQVSTLSCAILESRSDGRT